MENRQKQNIKLVILGVTLLVSLQNLGIVLEYIGSVISIISPIIIGGVIAFVLSVPIDAYSKLITKASQKLNKTLSYKATNLLSIILTLLTLILIIGIVMIVVVPEIIKSVNSIVEQVKIKWPEWQSQLANYNITIKSLTEYIETIDIKKYTSNISGVISGLVGTASSTISIGSTILFSLIAAFYTLLFRKEISRHLRKLLYANLKSEKADKIVNVFKLLKETYSKFLAGQCKESAILGILMFIALTIFKLPYAGLIAILTFVCAFIPYIGAFISCGVGVFLTLLSSPTQAIICLAVYQLIQFIEGQFIYPKVVGGSVGMLPIYTFLSVLIGGKLFGLVGILFIIPLNATLYILLSKNTNNKLRDKNIDIQ